MISSKRNTAVDETSYQIKWFMQPYYVIYECFNLNLIHSKVHHTGSNPNREYHFRSITTLRCSFAGQKLSGADAKKIEASKESDDWHTSFFARYRRPIGLLLPVCFVQFIYWSTFISYGRWYIFQEKYVMTLTMIFGGLIAGE